MCQVNLTRTMNRDRTHDGAPWRVLGLVTVRTPEGVLFGRLETRASDTETTISEAQFRKE